MRKRNKGSLGNCITMSMWKASCHNTACHAPVDHPGRPSFGPCNKMHKMFTSAPHSTCTSLGAQSLDQYLFPICLFVSNHLHESRACETAGRAEAETARMLLSFASSKTVARPQSASLCRHCRGLTVSACATAQGSPASSRLSPAASMPQHPYGTGGGGREG